MDEKSLSIFMQTSLAYECTVCKLYFGTENQLLSHHKGLHSRRLKVSLDTELSFKDDRGYNKYGQASSTSQLYSNSTEEPKDHNIAKLENKKAVSYSRITVRDSPKASADSICALEHQVTEGHYVQPPAKRIKTDAIRETACEAPELQLNDLNVISNRQYSESMKETIEKGQYGYLSDSKFHRFSLEELKKFAVQVVALFKLDESQRSVNYRTDHHDFNSNVSQTLDTMAWYLAMTKPEDLTGSLKSNYTSGITAVPRVPRDLLNTKYNSTDISRDDPKKSCYKCGEHGHFAWGCTNPRNREIQQKRKRRGKGRKKKHGTSKTSNCSAP